MNITQLPTANMKDVLIESLQNQIAQMAQSQCESIIPYQQYLNSRSMFSMESPVSEKVYYNRAMQSCDAKLALKSKPVKRALDFAVETFAGLEGHAKAVQQVQRLEAEKRNQNASIARAREAANAARNEAKAAQNALEQLKLNKQASNNALAKAKQNAKAAREQAAINAKLAANRAAELAKLQKEVNAARAATKKKGWTLLGSGANMGTAVTTGVGNVAGVASNVRKWVNVALGIIATVGTMAALCMFLGLKNVKGVFEIIGDLRRGRVPTPARIENAAAEIATAADNQTGGRNTGGVRINNAPTQRQVARPPANNYNALYAAAQSRRQAQRAAVAARRRQALRLRAAH